MKSGLGESRNAGYGARGDAEGEQRHSGQLTRRCAVGNHRFGGASVQPVKRAWGCRAGLGAGAMTGGALTGGRRLRVGAHERGIGRRCGLPVGMGRHGKRACREQMHRDVQRESRRRCACNGECGQQNLWEAQSTALELSYHNPERWPRADNRSKSAHQTISAWSFVPGAVC